jgi:CBS domain-containing protein
LRGACAGPARILRPRAKGARARRAASRDRALRTTDVRRRLAARRSHVHFFVMEARMKCEEIMKRTVRSVRDGDDAGVAARLMREHDIGFLPVCDPSGRVVGIVTDRDLVLHVCAENARAKTVMVRDIMTTKVIGVRPAHPVSYAERQMRSHRHTRVVVLGEQGQPLGILSLSDIAQYAHPSRIGRTMRVVAERKYAPERP